MNLGHYISTLLYTRNYVVIPNFGGFVSHEFGAEINEATQMFMPPTKRVSFQSALKESDFVLESLISKEEGISFKEVSKKLLELTSQWNVDLANGKHIKLENVGRVYLDNNQEIAFQSELNANFDADSFGLGIFRFPVLKEESPAKVISSKAMLSSVKNQTVSKIWQRAAAVVGIAGLLFIGSQKADFNTLNVASINPLRFSTTLVEPVADEIEVAKETAKEIEVPASAFGNINTEVSELPSLFEVNEASNYYVIVGAFKVQENASEFLNKVRASGFENAQYFYDKGFYKVSADHYSTKAIAKKSLSGIKQKIQNGAWIYRK